MRRRITASTTAPEMHLVDHISVLRALPDARLGTVGPYVFFDHLDRVRLSPASRLYVKPHPHAGLQVVTYVFSGALVHRDSLGNRSVAHPGEVHWLTAGRGVVHSEESYFATPEDFHDLELLQIWCGIPLAAKDVSPSFAHYASSSLPMIELGDASIRVVVGGCGGAVSPVRGVSPTLFLDLDFPSGGSAEVPVDPSFELGVYVVAGQVKIGERGLTKGQFARLEDGGDLVASAAVPGSRAVIVGGEPLAEIPVIHGGFVLGSMEEIQRTQHDYEEGRFGTIP